MVTNVKALHLQDSVQILLRFLLKKNTENNLYSKNLKLLWECCQIPDFEKKAYGQHLNIVESVFKFLSTKKKKIPDRYMKEQLDGLEKKHGNIDVLANRISNVRTWSYVANKKNWVENSDYWVQLTKKLEDRLSDRLHEELTKTFIDKRASVLARGLKQDMILDAEIDSENKVLIDGQYVGNLKGLKFNVDFISKNLDADLKSIKKAAKRGIEDELIKRTKLIIEEKKLVISEDNKIIWKNNPIAKMSKGENYLSPEIEIIADDALPAKNINDLEIFLKGWLLSHIEDVLCDLINLTKTKIDNQYLRALSFQLYENNGVLKRRHMFIIKLINKIKKKNFGVWVLKLEDIMSFYQKC